MRMRTAFQAQCLQREQYRPLRSTWTQPAQAGFGTVTPQANQKLAFTARGPPGRPLRDRLTRIALANVYHRNIEYSGSVYESMTAEGSTIRVKSSHAGGCLVAKGRQQVEPVPALRSDDFESTVKI